MNPIRRESLSSVLLRYNEPAYQFSGTGLPKPVSIAEYAVLVRTLHADDMQVDIYDAEYGLQLFDPKRSTPVGWIIPNPLRATHTEDPNA